MHFRPGLDEHGLRHNPFNALVVPRPIGWVSTRAADGALNIGPYSFFNAISYTPPQVLFSPGPRPASKGTDAGRKDSPANAEQTGDFVVNIATWDLREAMNLTSIEAPADVDEFAHAGLTPAPSVVVGAPRIAESPVALECKYLQTVTLKAIEGFRPNTLIIGEVVCIHVDDSILTDGVVDYAKFQPLARLGGNSYSVIRDSFTLDRPEWP